MIPIHAGKRGLRRLEPRRFRISVRHHGPVWEDGSSADQLWNTATWRQELSRETPLHPGDVLGMGAQGADGHLVPGDVIALEISDIGLLRHDVVAEEQGAQMHLRQDRRWSLVSYLRLSAETSLRLLVECPYQFSTILNPEAQQYGRGLLETLS